jgi:hypothetical protein
LGSVSGDGASRGDGQLGVDLFDAKEFDMIAESIDPWKSTGRFGVDINPAVPEALARQVARFEVELIVAQGAFVGVNVMGPMDNPIIPYILIHDHKVSLARRA